MITQKLIECSGSKTAITGKMSRKLYQKELRKLQVGRCHVQGWGQSRGIVERSSLGKRNEMWRGRLVRPPEAA